MERHVTENARRTFVFAVWFLATAAALALVCSCASNSPYADEWPWLDVVIGDGAFDAAWLMEPENHHRVPLAKLLYIGLGRITNYDFRAGAVANVVILSAASLVLMWAVRRARGITRLSDAILPVTLLHLGHWYNLIWGHQLFFAIAVAAMCAVIGIVVNTQGAKSAFRNGLLVALAGAVLIGCGGPGVCFLPAIALWLAYAGLALVRSTEPRRNLKGGTLVFAAGCGLLAVFFYFSGNRPTEGLPDTQIADGTASRLFATARGTLQVLSISAGRLGRDLWPVSGVVVGMIGLLALGRLAIVWRRQPDERLRVVGLACSIAAVVTVALGIGWSRGTLDPTYCLTARYTTLSCPLVVALYGVFLLYGRQPRWRFADATMAAVSVVIGVAYVSSGMHQSQEIRARVARMELLVADGISPAAIATRTSWDMQDEESSLARHLSQMQAAGIGPYRGVSKDLPAVDAAVARLSRQDPAVAQRASTVIAPDEPWIQVVDFSAGQHVFRIDLRVRNKLHRAPLPAAFAWKIVEHHAAGDVIVRAAGDCSLVDMPDPMFAPLRFAPFVAKADCRYELVVAAIASPDDKTPLKLPVFELTSEPGKNELDGFVYTLRDEATTVAAAESDGDVR